MSIFTTIRADGAVTLPDDWREKYNLQTGDAVLLVETDAGILLLPKVAAVDRILDEIGDGLRAKGISFEDMITRGREFRAEIIQEDYQVNVSNDDD